MSNTIIKIADISHTYTEGKTSIRALKHVSLEVASGEIVSIVGQSGCGKSTLLKIACGLVVPTNGYVLIDELPAIAARNQRKFGMVFQNPVLFPWRTVKENLSLPFELRIARRTNRNSPSDVERMIRDAAVLVGLEDFLNAYPYQLSGGMQARAAIARALSYKPEVMLMDEPFGSLDEITRMKLNEQLLKLHNRMQVSILVITHSISEAVFISNRVVVLTPRPGQIQTVLNIPDVHDRISWRETSEFWEICRKIRKALE